MHVKGLDALLDPEGIKIQPLGIIAVTPSRR
jgi:hypothetical protein